MVVHWNVFLPLPFCFLSSEGLPWSMGGEKESTSRKNSQKMAGRISMPSCLSSNPRCWINHCPDRRQPHNILFTQLCKVRILVLSFHFSVAREPQTTLARETTKVLFPCNCRERPWKQETKRIFKQKSKHKYEVHLLVLVFAGFGSAVSVWA